VKKRAAYVVQALEPRLLLSSPAIPLNNAFWTPIGPAGLSNGSSGRVAAIAADPNNSAVYYIASAGGGVWKTTDGGADWTPLTDTQTTLSIGAIAIAPTSTSTIYAATGEAVNSPAGLANYGQGVLKSTDGGKTWTLLGNSTFSRHTISQIVIDPTNASNVYVAVAGGGNNGVTGNTGIYKSTDGGTTWTNTTTAISTTAQFTDVEIDKSNAMHLFAAVGGGTSGSGIYVTTNGGTSWSLVGGGLISGTEVGWTKVAFAPSSTQTVYASFSNNATGSLLAMYRSTNGGGSWTQLVNPPNYLGTTASYDSTLAVDPKNPNIVYAGGGGGANSFIESTNSGNNWSDISTAVSGTSPHAAHHGIAFDADGHLLDGNDGGIWRLDNPLIGAQTWTNITANLQIGQYLGGALDPTNPNSAYAGSQGNGTSQFTGSTVWTALESGDNGAVRINPQTPTTLYHQSPAATFGAAGIVRVSTDGGTTWTNATTGITTSDPQSYFAPLIIDPNNGNHLFFGTNRVYETTNGASSWAPISTTNTNGWTTTGAINALAVAPSATGTIYASAGGHVFVTVNDGAAWTQIDPPNPVANLIVSPTNSQTVYGVTSTFGVPHVFQSINGGTTWTNITGNLPDLPTYTLAINGSTLYVGNDNGVWASTNGGTSWSALGSGMPNVEVRDLEFNSTTNTVAAFTLGRGVFEISTSLPNIIDVNTTADETTPGDGFTSLREAVTQGNVSGGTIVFDPTIIGQTLTLTAANGNISIGNNVTINGPTTGSITISDGGGVAIEVASSASVTLSNITVSGTGTVLQVDSTGQALLQDVTVTGNVTDNGAINLYQFVSGTLTGSISGTGSLTKTGWQSLTLSGTNTYGGGTTVGGGTLIGNTNSLVGNITGTNPGTLMFDQSALTGTTGTFSGNVTGTGGIHIAAPPSTVQMGATATFSNSGPTVIDAGASLIAAATNDLGSSSTFFVNGTLNLGGFSQTIGALDGAPSGQVVAINTVAPLTAQLTFGGNNAVSTVFAGQLRNVPSGTGAGAVLLVQKTGTGTETLSNVNSFTGGTTLAGGQLNINNASALGTGPFTISGVSTIDNTSAAAITLPNNPETWSADFTFRGTQNLNVGSGAITLSSSRNITVNGGILTVGGNITGGTSSITKAGAGTLVLFGTNSFSGGFNLTAGQVNINTNTAIGSGPFTIGANTSIDNSGTLLVTLTNNNPLTLNGNVTFIGSGPLDLGNSPVTLSATDTITVNGSTLTLDGPISGAFGLIKNGNGTLKLTGTDSYSAGTVINAGTVLGNSNSLQGTITDNSQLTFDQTIGSLTTGTFNGSVGGSGSLTFLNGTVQLASGDHLTNFGDTLVGGTLVCPTSNGLNALSNLSFYTVNGVMDLSSSSQTIASLSGSGTIYHFQPAGQPALVTLTVGGDNSSQSFTGFFEDTIPASGNGGILAVTKVGTGTLTLTGANTFTGGLSVMAGTLIAGPSAVAADPLGAGTVTLNGGSLGLDGKLNTPVQQIVPVTGFNQDVIVEAGAASATAATTIAFDGAGGNDWYETGFPGSGTTGLPTNGSMFTSAFNSAVKFQLQPYAGNNAAFINGGNGSVTLNLTTPTAFSMLNVLASASNGASAISATLNFGNSNFYFAQFSVNDWFATGGNTAFTAGGRILRSTSALSLSAGNGKLYEYDITIPPAFQALPLTSITFNEVSGAQVGIFALSGAASVISASQPYPNAIQVLNNSTIDVENSLSASLGNLTMGAGLLALTGPTGASLFMDPVLNVNSTFDIAAGTTMSLAAVSGGPSITLTKLGAGTLVLTGTDTYGGGTTVSAGTLVAATGTSLPTNGALNIGVNGTVTLQQNASAFTANIGSLSIQAGGKLDLGNNKMFINYGSPAADPITTILTYLTNGYNGGAWTGTASGGSILSSRAASNPNHSTAIGYADSADLTGTNTTPNSIELLYTLYGDANLDTIVNSADLQALLARFNLSGNWDQGNFNYDSVVNSADLQVLLAYFNTALGSQVAPAPSPVTPLASLNSPTSSPPTAAIATPTVTVPPTTPLSGRKSPQKKHR
jgi:autotransporter-associated beta strand protein